jgi:arylsulfatase
MEFHYDGGGLAKGGTAVLALDGTKIGEGRVDATIPMLFAADETLDLGKDNGSAVSDDYTPENSAFTGTVNWVQLDTGEDSQDHLLTPQDRIRAAMTRQ